MPDNTRSLEERLHEAAQNPSVTRKLADGETTSISSWPERNALLDEAANALGAKDKLLAEAREALEPFVKAANEHEEWAKSSIAPPTPNYSMTVYDCRSARTTLANLKAGLDIPSTLTKES